MGEQTPGTYIDAINQFWKVWENGNRRSLNASMCLYFYLCKIWNTSGRPLSFRRQNTELMASIMISKPTLESQRNTLKQHGLIEFISKGKGDPNISYQILEVKNIYFQEVKKEKKITSDFTSDFTSGLDINKEKELFVVVAGEVKKIDYLEKEFTADQGLILKWVQNGFAEKEFTDGLQCFCLLKNGQEYSNLKEVRNNFFFWMPNYPNFLNKNNETDRRTSKNGNPAKQGTSELRVNALKNWGIGGSGE